MSMRVLEMVVPTDTGDDVHAIAVASELETLLLFADEGRLLDWNSNGHDCWDSEMLITSGGKTEHRWRIRWISNLDEPDMNIFAEHNNRVRAQRV